MVDLPEPLGPKTTLHGPRSSIRMPVSQKEASDRISMEVNIGYKGCLIPCSLSTVTYAPPSRTPRPITSAPSDKAGPVMIESSWRGTSGGALYPAGVLNFPHLHGAESGWAVHLEGLRHGRCQPPHDPRLAPRLEQGPHRRPKAPVEAEARSSDPRASRAFGEPPRQSLHSTHVRHFPLVRSERPSQPRPAH